VTGYLIEIEALQLLQRAPRMTQLNTGMLSDHRMGQPHEGQWLPGFTIDFPSGTRQATTLRKLPIQRPKRNAKIAKIVSKAIAIL
jgi:hypothetical protein